MPAELAQYLLLILSQVIGIGLLAYIFSKKKREGKEKNK